MVNSSLTKKSKKSKNNNSKKTFNNLYNELKVKRKTSNNRTTQLFKLLQNQYNKKKPKLSPELLKKHTLEADRKWKESKQRRNNAEKELKSAIKEEEQSKKVKDLLNRWRGGPESL